VTLEPRDFDLHVEVNQANARRLNLEADIVLVHDPQPIYLPRFTTAGAVRRWIWRCHIDASRPARDVWKHLEAALPRYTATVFSMAAFTRPLSCPMFVVPPSIDPLSDENCALPAQERLETLTRFGINPDRPMLLQVSRFDRFKDPLGVIAAYRLLKPYDSELQLVLAGGSADDDPEGSEVLREVMEEGRGAQRVSLGRQPDCGALRYPRRKESARRHR
jgi:trehalose synthase